MKQGARTGVDRVDITGQVEGVQLEAVDASRVADSLKPRSDSLPPVRSSR
jgi:hypothetical protein